MCSSSFLKPIQKDPLIKIHRKTDPIQRSGKDPVAEAIFRKPQQAQQATVLSPTVDEEKQTKTRTFGMSGNATNSFTK